jgi:hypothetical protein
VGEFQFLAAQFMILFQVAVGGAAFWGACRLMNGLGRKDSDLSV